MSERTIGFDDAMNAAAKQYDALKAALAEAQADVALRNGECEAKSHIISDLENENSKLRNRIGVLQASPPACEGERVDLDAITEEIANYAWPMPGCQFSRPLGERAVLDILRRHFPPAAPKPAAGGEKPAQALPADDGERVREEEVERIRRLYTSAPKVFRKYIAKVKDLHCEEDLCKLLWFIAAQSAELDALRAELHALKNPPPYIPVLCKYCGNDTHHIGDVCFFCGNDEADAKEDKPNG